MPAKLTIPQHLTGVILLVVLFSNQTRASTFPKELEDVPSNTSLVFFFPKVSSLIRDLSSTYSLLLTLQPQLKGKNPGDTISALLWGAQQKSLLDANPQSTGIAFNKPTSIRFSNNFHTAVVSLPLQNKEAFINWLRSIKAPNQSERAIDGHQGVILAPSSIHPIICVVRELQGLCQINALEKNSLQPLKTHLNPSQTTWKTDQSIHSAWNNLPKDIHMGILGKPSRLVQDVYQVWQKQLEYQTRLLDSKQREILLEQYKAFSQRTLQRVSLATAIAGSTSRNNNQIQFEAIVGLSSEGVKHLHSIIPPAHKDSIIYRWASTPALFGLFLRLNPSFVANICKNFGLSVPVQDLTGALGLLTFNLDTAGPHAFRRPQSLEGTYGWTLVLDSTFALGLKKQSAPHTETLKYTTTSSVHLKSIHLYEDMLLAGTSPMSNYAAKRRLKSLSHLDSFRPLQPNAFAWARLDIATLNAILSSRTLSEKHREELIWLETTRQKLSPILIYVRQVEFGGQLSDNNLRLSLKVGFNH